VPAAAVIPAPIAYIKVVAVKKLVVGFQNSERPVCLLIFFGGFVLISRFFFLRGCRDLARKQGWGGLGATGVLLSVTLPSLYLFLVNSMPPLIKS